MLIADNLNVKALARRLASSVSTTAPPPLSPHSLSFCDSFSFLGAPLSIGWLLAQTGALTVEPLFRFVSLSSVSSFHARNSLGLGKPSHSASPPPHAALLFLCLPSATCTRFWTTTSSPSLIATSPPYVISTSSPFLTPGYLLATIQRLKHAFAPTTSKSRCSSSSLSSVSSLQTDD